MSRLLRCCIVVVVLAGLLGAMCLPLAAAGAKPQEDIAVAAFYYNFHDMTDAEVKQYLDLAASEYAQSHPERKSA